jgi:hypothetical protein
LTILWITLLIIYYHYAVHVISVRLVGLEPSAMMQTMQA